MAFCREDGDYIRYNINGGDSNAYWVNRDNPTIVHCFKPDEKPFLFKNACPEMYEWHLEQFGGFQTQEIANTGEKIRFEPVAFIEENSDKVYKMKYDSRSDTIHFLAESSRPSIADWFQECGLAEPPFIESKRIEMRPDTMKQYDGTVINLFRPTELMLHYAQEEGKGEFTYGDAHFLFNLTPNIATIIYHVLGSDEAAMEHFINWLAYVFQTRSKSQTAWLLHGCEGTGKGMLFKKVLRPMFGQHSVQKTLMDIADDQFNDWMLGSIMVFVDEFNINNTSSGVGKAANLLKNRITEDSFSVRAMRVSQKDAEQFMNFVFATNDIGAVKLSSGDRRHNVAPRQNRKLEDVYPRFKYDQIGMDDTLEGEIEAFAKFIGEFRYQLPEVRRAMMTEAKEQARLEGMNSQESFAYNLRTGNLEYFIDLLNSSPTSVPTRKNVWP